MRTNTSRIVRSRQVSGAPGAPTRALAAVMVLLAFGVSSIGAGCGGELDVGSDVLFSARHEEGTFGEWSAVVGGSAQAFPTPPNLIAVSSERARQGAYAAKLTIEANTAGFQQNALLSRAGGLPTEAYYSAWYYLPRSVSVGGFWVIFKFRLRGSADDPSTSDEFYDLDLHDLPSGEMTLLLYDHRTAHNVTLEVPDPVVPVGSWFQLEAFYRNTNDATGRLTAWLNGQQFVDITGQPMAPNSWVEWDACSIGENLSPNPVVLFIDDCAVSRTRVGTTGLITR